VAQQNLTHPYLFFNSGDIASLRTAASTTHKTHFDNLVAWAAKFIGFSPIPPGSLPTDRDVLQVYYENSAPYVINMALLFHLTNDTKYRDAAKNWLLTFITYPTETNGGYFIGAYALAVAGGYDLLYNELSASERTSVRQHIAALLARGQQGTSSDWWAGITLNHDHWLPVAGLGVGAVAIYEEDASAPSQLTHFLNIIKEDIGIVGNDGAWTEGTADWAYAMAMTYIFFDAYKRMSGANLFNDPFTKNGIAYRLYNWLPNDTYIYHHDSFENGRYNVMGSASCHLMRKLATEHQDGHAQWLAAREEAQDLEFITQQETPNADWNTNKSSLVPALHCVGWNYLWYDPSVTPQAPDDLPLYHHFTNQDLVIIRSGWQPKDVVFTFTCAPVGGHSARAAFLGGNTRMLANYGHTHTLANTFNLYINGSYLAVPPCYGQLSSDLHNTLTIEGASQVRHPQHEARIIKNDAQNDYIYLAGDATKCYPSHINLARWYRHVAYLPPNVFVLGDELIASSTSTAGRTTKWHLDYQPQNAPVIDRTNHKLGVRSFTGASMIVDFLHPLPLSYESRNLNWAAKQLTASRDNTFGSQRQEQILAVVTALENTSAQAPAARYINGPNVMGAVIDGTDQSRAAVFAINDENSQGNLVLEFDILSKTSLTCHVFSLLPNTGYDVLVSSQPGGGGLTLYSLTVQRGTLYTANAQGSITLQLPGNPIREPDLYQPREKGEGQNGLGLEGSMGVFALSGKCVKILNTGQPGWDGTDTNYKQVPAGVYLLKKEGTNILNKAIIIR
jgi:hypothetical protein